MICVNVGWVEGGIVSNVIVDEVEVVVEVCGEMIEFMEYVKFEFCWWFEKVVELYGCEVMVDVVSESFWVDSDFEFVEVVVDVVEIVESVDCVV